MKSLHIQSVDVVTNGLVVTYDDETRAFYDESVLMAHLADAEEKPLRKRPKPVEPAASRTQKRMA